MITRMIKEYQVPVRRTFARQLSPYALEASYATPWQWQHQHLGYAQWPQYSHLQYGQVCPETDVLELDDRFLLEIALPGVTMDDVELKAEENTLTVFARRTPTAFEEKAIVLRKELPCALYVRQFEFDRPILVEQIEARMDRGLLFVSIPKIEIAQRIPVSAGAIEAHLPGVRTPVTSSRETIRKEVTTVK